jgi:hypothetical protein
VTAFFARTRFDPIRVISIARKPQLLSVALAHQLTAAMTGRTKAKRGGFRSAYSKKRSSPDEGDAPPRASKKAKGDDEEDESATLVPKLQKDEQGDSYVAVRVHSARYMNALSNPYS